MDYFLIADEKAYPLFDFAVTRARVTHLPRSGTGYIVMQGDKGVERRAVRILHDLSKSTDEFSLLHFRYL